MDVEFVEHNVGLDFSCLVINDDVKLLGRRDIPLTFY